MRSHRRADPLAAARRRARQRIEDDRRRSPEALRPVFEALSARLFEPGFNAKTVAPEAAIRRRFRLEVGPSLRVYRDRRLLEAALELVRKTALPVVEIAAGLGFDDPELFSKWFKRRTGESPVAMRSPSGPQLPPAASPAPPAAEPTGGASWTVRECRQAAAWDVSPERGAALAEKIRELYPALADPPRSE